MTAISIVKTIITAYVREKIGRVMKYTSLTVQGSY